jgi:hypothetical protein
MGEWKYRKPEPAHVRGLCCHCGLNPQKKKSKGGYQPLCSGCEKRKYQSIEGKARHKAYVKQYQKENGHYSRPYTKHKTDVCAMCSFSSEYPCQFDVDHIDGNHSNNDLSNLQTLCANCHRLKTLLNGEGIYRFHK